LAELRVGDVFPVADNVELTHSQFAQLLGRCWDRYLVSQHALGEDTISGHGLQPLLTSDIGLLTEGFDPRLPEGATITALEAKAVVDGVEVSLGYWPVSPAVPTLAEDDDDEIHGHPV